jgi:Flp pilus assembly pilin Flp
MIVALISVTLMGIWGALSGSISTSFTKISTSLANANAAK